MYSVLLSYSSLNNRFKHVLRYKDTEKTEDNLQKENSIDKYKSLTSGKRYFSSYGSTSVKGTVILFGRTTNHTTTSYITLRIMSLKKREVREPHITSNPD